MHRHNFPLGLAEVHPRIRGEYNNPIQTKKCMKGSPPHPRGILSAELPPGTGRQVHPRIRGEYGILSSTSTVLPGSPPHPRGIFLPYYLHENADRFTPASAGNIAKRELDSSSRRVHPRIRGEYLFKNSSSDIDPGSPPHPRGIYFDMQDSNIQKRFTPASAGNIRCLTLCQTLHWVHPRIRGEYSDGVTYRTYVMGSPPHPRGIFTGTVLLIGPSRFTPASAGNIHPLFVFRIPPWVHPRIRGEYCG